MLNVGIECESIEGPESWGVGRVVKKILENIASQPELAQEFKFFLFFKSHIPELPFLNNSIFVKKIIGTKSFSLYYYLLLPIKLWFQKNDIMFFPNYMLPILFKGKSLVVLTEDIYYEINSGTLPFRYKMAYQIFSGWWATNHATKVMTISETSKKEVARLFKIDPERIFVNTLGIDPPQKPTTNNQALPNNYILYVGQAFPRRRLKETMLAFEIIASEQSDLQLIAIGKDKYTPPILEKLSQDINRRLGREAIIYRDYVGEDELHVLYTKARLLIYVSSKEAFGLPPLEALSYGIPPVVADSELNNEIYEGNAFLVRDPESPESIAGTIKKALNDESMRQEIIANAPGILEKYTWQKHTEMFLKIIRQKNL